MAIGLERDPTSVLVGYMLPSAVLWVSGSWAPQQVGQRGVVEREGSTASMESTGEEKRQGLGRFQKDGILEVRTWPGFLLVPSDTAGCSPRPQGRPWGTRCGPGPSWGPTTCPVLCSFLLQPRPAPRQPGQRLRCPESRTHPLAPTCPSLISLAPHGHTATIRKLC